MDGIARPRMGRLEREVRSAVQLTGSAGEAARRGG